MGVKIKEFWKQYEPKIVLFIGLILVAAISFEFGLMQRENGQISPLIIEKALSSQAGGSQAPSASPPGAQNLAREAEKSLTSGNNITPQKCAFVGSKNSNKYHTPTCTFAKRIKPENIVCFASTEDAAAKGYQPDKGCVK